MDRRTFHRTVLAGAAAAAASALPLPAADAQLSTTGPPLPLPPHPGDVLPPGAATRLGTTRFWHQVERGNDGVNALAFSPDGQTLATGLSDGTTLLWNLTTAEAGPKEVGE
jgi:WD40 repeat protein